MFKVRVDAEEFLPKEKNWYSKFLENLLFLCCRVRPEILAVVFILTTGLKKSDLNYYKKK